MAEKEENVITPEIVKNELDDARRMFKITGDISDVTSDDLLQKIFEISNEVQGEEAKEAVGYRIAIDAMQFLYKEIRSRPAKKTKDIDRSDRFLRDWGIIEDD